MFSKRKILLFILIFTTFKGLEALEGIVLLGSPGSGKGTYCEALLSKKDLHYIPPGNLLRAEVKANSAIGQMIRSKIEKGELVDNEIVFSLVEKELELSILENRSFLLDAFPQSIESAYSLNSFINHHPDINMTYILLDAPQEVCIERICSRLICENCSKIYNEKFKPPIQFGFCDECHGTLYRRHDDHYESAIKRVNVFHQKMEGVLKVFKENNYPITIINTTSEVSYDFS
ncbi:nucleoside monophosphate kinase [Chlamydiales bacterium]|nr:nucleoside monophosphate kinase [Chlamydiales bacterium]